MALDEHGQVRAVPKPERTKKARPARGTKTAKPTKTVANLKSLPEKQDAVAPLIEEGVVTTGGSVDRTEVNRLNRQRGKSAEREIARRTGGARTPGSGAIKNSVKNLEGDVRVHSEDGSREFLVIEVKSTANLSPKGEKNFNLKKAVLDQAFAEADLIGAIGALAIHWAGNDFSQDYWVLRPDDVYRLVALARIGANREAA